MLVVIFLPDAGKPNPINLYSIFLREVPVPFSVFLILSLAFTSSSTSI